MKQIIIAFILSIFSSPPLASVEICQIIYNKQAIDFNKKSLEHKDFFLDENRNKCSQIGLEHDLQRNPLSNKPIFACCRESKGIEVAPGYL